MNDPDSDPLPIIPLPKELSRKSGAFTITPETVISADAVNRSNATVLQELISSASGFPMPIHGDETAPENVISLATSTEGEVLGREGYTLDASPNALVISAPTPTGIYYGIQTLRQLLPKQIENRTVTHGITWRIPSLTIHDDPRFRWRGCMLDEARHFQGKETVLRALELMALHKLNVFHWHLTDDQGWRVEIERYPKLTEIGSVRKGTSQSLVGRHDAVPHSGYYTQDDIKEIIAYAAARHITIVPEIEMPGHCKAALAAYPALSCTGGPFEVSTRFAPTFDVFCPGKESVFTFLENVLDEVMALFPAPYIHIGGDEVLKRRWKKCPDCQHRIAEEGLGDVGALQDYFTDRIAAYVAARGRRLVGWNEILHDGLDHSAIVQYWIRHRKQVVEAVRTNGRDVVISSFMSLYLDHSYSLTPLSKAYAFEPVFPEFNSAEAEHVLGLEAPLWTEFVPNQARLDYQTYPRLTAFAETGWTPKKRKDPDHFSKRLRRFQERLDLLNVKYAPQGDVEPSRLKQLFGVLTIVRPQTKTAE